MFTQFLFHHKILFALLTLNLTKDLITFEKLFIKVQILLHNNNLYKEKCDKNYLK